MINNSAGPEYIWPFEKKAPNFYVKQSDDTVVFSMHNPQIIWAVNRSW